MEETQQQRQHSPRLRVHGSSFLGAHNSAYRRGGILSLLDIRGHPQTRPFLASYPHDNDLTPTLAGLPVPCEGSCSSGHAATRCCSHHVPHSRSCSGTHVTMRIKVPGGAPGFREERPCSQHKPATHHMHAVQTPGDKSPAPVASGTTSRQTQKPASFHFHLLTNKTEQTRKELGEKPGELFRVMAAWWLPGLCHCE